MAPYLIVPPAPTVKIPWGFESIASEIVEGDGRWETGVSFQNPVCGPASLYSNCFSVDDEESPSGEGITGIKSFEDGIPSVRNGAFGIYGAVECSPIGDFWNIAMGRSRDYLINGRERALESAVALGTAVGGTGQYLTDASTVDITPTPGTPVTVAQGFALLEQWIGANSAGQGAILGARRDVLLGMSDWVVVPATPGQKYLYTGLTTPVAALSGFDGMTGPGGVATDEGEAWLYAIGSQPRIWRGSIFDIPRDESLDTAYNNQYALTEQIHSYSWNCGTAAILITSV